MTTILYLLPNVSVIESIYYVYVKYEMRIFRTYFILDIALIFWLVTSTVRRNVPNVLQLYIIYENVIPNRHRLKVWHLTMFIRLIGVW